MEIKREVNEILQKKVRDPRARCDHLTDSDARWLVSVANIYYTILSNLASDNQKTKIGWKKNWYHQTWELAQFLKLYKIPDLTFVKDEYREYGQDWRDATQYL